MAEATFDDHYANWWGMTETFGDDEFVGFCVETTTKKIDLASVTKVVNVATDGVETCAITDTTVKCKSIEKANLLARTNAQLLFKISVASESLILTDAVDANNDATTTSHVEIVANTVIEGATTTSEVKIDKIETDSDVNGLIEVADGSHKTA